MKTMNVDALIGGGPSIPARAVRACSFPAVSILALIQGGKTQDRAIVDPQPIACVLLGDEEYDGPKQVFVEDGRLRTPQRYGSKLVDCPFGKPGDRLWLREPYCFENFFEADGVDDWGATVSYAADGQRRRVYQCDAPADVGFWPGARIRQHEGTASSATSMPQWASRLALEVTETRIERLQDISEADAVAEGVYRNQEGSGGGWRYAEGEATYAFAASAYRELWETVNGAGAWEANPWVWVRTFKRIDPRES
jgi:hypothetical protein